MGECSLDAKAGKPQARKTAERTTKKAKAAKSAKAGRQAGQGSRRAPGALTAQSGRPSSRGRLPEAASSRR